MDLENFKKNAKNNFVLLNVGAGTRLNIKGTNLKETAALFLGTMDRKKEFKIDTPEAFKEGEAILLEGIDKESGNFVVYLVMPQSTANNPKYYKILREFQSVN
jgi:hypothetical protein